MTTATAIAIATATATALPIVVTAVATVSPGAVGRRASGVGPTGGPLADLESPRPTQPVPPGDRPEARAR
jgi:hypothetical protein